MPIITDHVVLPCPAEKAFREAASVAFMRRLDPNFGTNTTVLYENARIMRAVSRVERVGEVEIERIVIPESRIILTQRKAPLAPFVYQLSIQTFAEHAAGTLLIWVDDFVLDDANKPKEAMILEILRKNDTENLRKAREYFSGKDR